MALTHGSPEYFEQAAKDIEAFSGLYAYAATNNAVREMAFRGACRSFRDAFLSAAALARELERVRANEKAIYERNVLTRNAHTEVESATRDLQERNTALEIAAEWAEEKITSLQADLDTAQVNSDRQDKRIMQLQAELTATRESLHEWRRQFNKACEDANKAEAEVDRLKDVVREFLFNHDQGISHNVAPLRAIAYTGTEPQEEK